MLINIEYHLFIIFTIPFLYFSFKNKRNAALAYAAFEKNDCILFGVVFWELFEPDNIVSKGTTFSFFLISFLIIVFGTLCLDHTPNIVWTFASVELAILVGSDGSLIITSDTSSFFIGFST